MSARARPLMLALAVITLAVGPAFGFGDVAERDRAEPADPPGVEAGVADALDLARVLAASTDAPTASFDAMIGLWQVYAADVTARAADAARAAGAMGSATNGEGSPAEATDLMVSYARLAESLARGGTSDRVPTASGPLADPNGSASAWTALVPAGAESAFADLFVATAAAVDLQREATADLSASDRERLGALHAAWREARAHEDRGLLGDAWAEHGTVLSRIDAVAMAASARTLVDAGERFAVAMGGLGDTSGGSGASVAGSCLSDGLGVIVLCDAGDGVSSGDHVLTIDLGGNDVHTGNAGASGLDILWSGNNGLPVALAVELGGSDTYVRPNYAQGAGSSTPGVLLDLEGNDRYSVTNGFFGFGQGAGNLGGVGFLFDALGDDSYVGRATDPSSGPGWDNAGFGILGGFGALVDATGNDDYDGGLMSQGTGDFQSVGVLVDAEGHDSRVATRFGMGFADGAGLGILVDGLGDDGAWAFDRLTQGAGRGGTGIYVDLAGDDRYSGSSSRGYFDEGPFWKPLNDLSGLSAPGSALFIDAGAGADRYAGAGCDGCVWGTDGLGVDL